MRENNIGHECAVLLPRLCDASSVVRLMFDEQGQPGQHIGDFAEKLLREQGDDIVARHIWENVVSPSSDDFVIGGFRAIPEIEFFREVFPSCAVISSAPQRLRYERYVRRDSRDYRTEKEFAMRDEQQFMLGLLRVADELSDVMIDNSYSPDHFKMQLARVLGLNGSEVRGVSFVPPRVSKGAK